MGYTFNTGVTTARKIMLWPILILVGLRVTRQLIMNLTLKSRFFYQHRTTILPHQIDTINKLVQICLNLFKMVKW